MGRSIHNPEPQSQEHSDSVDSLLKPHLTSSIPASSAVAVTQPKPMRWLLGSVAFGLTATVSAVVGMALMVLTPLSPAIAPDNEGRPMTFEELWQRSVGYRITRPVNILVMGVDRVPDIPEDSPEILEGRSDTMLVIRVNPTDESVSLLSIPRDTQVYIPGDGITKINHANMEGGPELAAEVTSGLLNQLPIDRYVRVSTEAFRELVDLVGGIEIFVPERMYYVDQTQQLYIDLEEGWQILNGDQAEQFARFRADGQGDVGRVQRQQQLIQALRDRLIHPTVIPKLPEIIQLFQQYVDTNLSPDEMLALVTFGLNIDQEQFRMVMLPGRFSSPDEFIASYWIMDSEGRDQVMAEYFQMGDVAQTGDRPRSLNRLSIAVQNASGDDGAGRAVANYLRDQGFSNVYVISDWGQSLPQTQIIVQRGALRDANRLERLLGVGRVVAASTGDLSSDLTIRVGDDWAEFFEQLR